MNRLASLGECKGRLCVVRGTNMDHMFSGMPGPLSGVADEEEPGAIGIVFEAKGGVFVWGQE